MAVFRSLIYFIGFGGLGYILMKVLAKDDKSQCFRLRRGTNQSFPCLFHCRKNHEYRHSGGKNLPSDYSVSHGESLKKRQAIVDVLRRAAEDREPMYRQTKEQIDAQRAEDSSKKKR